ncbi:Ribosome biogenesis regulatory protein-like [Cricetulus griseus]|uniref:Ribosome biogenesis regulatory protein-like n=1 Tax=Cricetulus griseus TaxID=10029 RepID=G3HZT4_CRIGR|nr:Ribosome biogenesis regulatory protein-like [Cricetulus griseus]
MEGPNVGELRAKVEQEAAEKLQGIAVHKELELELDLDNLLASDRDLPPSPRDGAAPGWALGQGRAADPGAGQHAAAHQPAAGSSSEEQFAKRIQAKKDHVAKNELNRLRNLARASAQGPDAQLSRPAPSGTPE